MDDIVGRACAAQPRLSRRGRLPLADRRRSERPRRSSRPRCCRRPGAVRTAGPAGRPAGASGRSPGPARAGRGRPRSGRLRGRWAARRDEVPCDTERSARGVRQRHTAFVARRTTHDACAVEGNLPPLCLERPLREASRPLGSSTAGRQRQRTSTERYASLGIEARCAPVAPTSVRAGGSADEPHRHEGPGSGGRGADLDVVAQRGDQRQSQAEAGAV